MGLLPGSIAYVDSMEAFRATECTFWNPVCVYPRNLPFNFNAAAEVIVRHGNDFCSTASHELSLERLKELAVRLPDLQTAFNNSSLYSDAKPQIDFIISDMTGWRQDDAIDSMLRFVPATGYQQKSLHRFHRDLMTKDQTRRMCTYTADATEGLRQFDARKQDDEFTPCLWGSIQRLSPGDISKHNAWWIHRAPFNAGPRLVLIEP